MAKKGQVTLESAGLLEAMVEYLKVAVSAEPEDSTMAEPEGSPKADPLTAIKSTHSAARYVCQGREGQGGARGTSRNADPEDGIRRQ